jgi:hypothetical protein
MDLRTLDLDVICQVNKPRMCVMPMIKDVIIVKEFLVKGKLLKPKTSASPYEEVICVVI